MPRFNAKSVQFTPEQEAEADARDALFNSKPEIDKRFNRDADRARQIEFLSVADSFDLIWAAVEAIDAFDPRILPESVKSEITRRKIVKQAHPKR